MATKVGKVVAYDIGHHAQSHIVLWSRDHL